VKSSVTYNKQRATREGDLVVVFPGKSNFTIVGYVMEVHVPRDEAPVSLKLFIMHSDVPDSEPEALAKSSVDGHNDIMRVGDIVNHVLLPNTELLQGEIRMQNVGVIPKKDLKAH